MLSKICFLSLVVTVLSFRDEFFEKEGSDDMGAFIPDILPPKYRPGESLRGTTEKGVNRALDEILKSSKLTDTRNCAVAVANIGGSKLINPHYYLRSGMTKASPPYEVDIGYTSLNLFINTFVIGTGSVGVLSYDIEGTDHKVAMLWSMPYNWLLYDAWFNVKVYPKSYATDSHMYKQMYNYGPWKAMSWEERIEYGVHVRATMTNSKDSKLQVYVNTDDYDAEGAKDHHAECNYHAGWFGSYC